jgi:hypothetical protein
MKKKLLFAAAMLLAAVGVNAQTDVTSTYLTNADFEASTALTSDFLYGYSKDGSPSGFQAVDGWSYTILKYDGNEQSGMGGGVVAYGSNTALKGNNKKAPTNAFTDGEKNSLAFFGVWGCGGYYYQEVELPAGGYELTIPVYNASGTQGNTSYIGFIPNEGTSHTVACNPSVEVWTTLTVKFTLTEKTAGRIALGYKSNGSGSGANPHLFFESVSITWTDPLVSLKAEYQEALAAATAANEDPVYSNVDGSERIALNNSISDTPEETAESYSEVIKALTDATAAFKAAKSAYDLAASTPELPYSDPDKAPVIDEGTDAANLLIAIRAYYESNAAAEGMEGAADVTSKLTNAKNQSNTNGWTVNNTTGNCNLRTMSNEPYVYADGTTATGYLDTNSWGSAFASSVTQNVELYPGKYILSVKARGAETTTYQLTANDKTVDITSMGNTGGVFDRGWNSYTVEFELEEAGSVALGVNFAGDKWLSFGDFQLVQLELYTEMADADDYAALAAAIEEAEAKTLGFDAGEYAPYNNIEALQALAAAKTIDPENPGGNAKEEVVNATTALNSAWTANTEEVNAIYDGVFANTEANTTSGDINLPGWTKVQGIRLLVKDVEENPGLANTDGKAAVFSWGGTTLTYGEQTGYTLPLNAHQVYELSFKISGWRDGGFPSVVTATLDGVSYTLNPSKYVSRINDAEGNPFKEVKFYLTPEAENSILKIYANQHFTVADLKLMQVAGNLAINDAQSYDIMQCGKIDAELTRTIKEGVNSVVLPFELNADDIVTLGGEGAVAYTVSGYDAEKESLKLAEAESVLANTPFFLKATAAGTSFVFDEKTIVAGEPTKTVGDVTLVGTYAKIDAVPTGSYILSGGKFYLVNSTVSLKPTRAYVTVPAGAGAKSVLNVEVEDATAIVGVESEVANSEVYDIAGRKVSAPARGLYIANGKKVLVK